MTSSQFIDMLRTAQMQLRIAKALYRPRWNVLDLASSFGGRAVWVASGNARAAALIFSDHVHLVVSGSDDRHDWLQNFNADQVDYKGLACHQGFSTAADWLLESFERRRLFDEIGDRQLVIGGHSAGGSIAQLLSIHPKLRPRELFTFGSPRVWAPSAAAFYSGYSWRTRRFVADGDPVPWVPLRQFRCLFGRAKYAHASAALHLTDAGEVLMDQEAGAIRKAAHIASAAWVYGVAKLAEARDQSPTLLMRKHSVKRYETAINNALERVT